MQYLNKNLLTFCHDTLLQGHFFQVENLMVTCYIHYQIWTALNIFIKSPTPSICQEPALLKVDFWDRSAGYALYFCLSIRKHLLLLANPLSNSSMPSPSPTPPVPLPEPWPSAASQPRCPASSGCPCCPPGRTPWPTLAAGHNFPAFLQEDPLGQLEYHGTIQCGQWSPVHLREPVPPPLLSPFSPGTSLTPGVPPLNSTNVFQLC